MSYTDFNPGQNNYDPFYNSVNFGGGNLDMYDFKGLPMAAPNSFNGYSGGNAGGQAGASNSTSPLKLTVTPNPTGTAQQGSSNPMGQVGGSPVASGGIAPGGMADYFARGVIIILGFIFVAVGLNMFKPGIVYNPAPGLARV